MEKAKRDQGVGEDSRGIRQRSGRGKGFPPRGLKYLLRGQKINPPRDSKGLRKTRQGSVKGHEERHEGEKEIHQGSGSTRRSRLTSRISVDQHGADTTGRGHGLAARLLPPHRFSLRLPARRLPSRGSDPDLSGSAGVPPASCPGHRFRPRRRLRAREQIGNMVDTLPGYEALSWCLFVFIRGSSSLMIGRFSSNDRHGRAEARLTTNH